MTSPLRVIFYTVFHYPNQRLFKLCLHFTNDYNNKAKVSFTVGQIHYSFEVTLC
jgi:hypothetical protein